MRFAWMLIIVCVMGCQSARELHVQVKVTHDFTSQEKTSIEAVVSR